MEFLKVEIERVKYMYPTISPPALRKSRSRISKKVDLPGAKGRTKLNYVAKEDFI